VWGQAKKKRTSGRLTGMALDAKDGLMVPVPDKQLTRV
jgi:hypothetical protein